MKKTLVKTSLLACLTLLLSFPSSAFGLKTASQDTQKQAAGTEAAQTLRYDFKSGDTLISMDADADQLLPLLGTPKRTFEQDSCAYQGKDKVYTFDGFELSVYPKNGKNLVASVYIPADSKASTPEGIGIGASADAVIKAYGPDYVEQWGVYRYTASGTTLVFYTTNGAVDAIEYQLQENLQ